MTLLDRIKQDRVDALKAHDKDKATFLAYVVSEGQKVGKTVGNRDSTDDEVMGAIRGIIRRNTDAMGFGLLDAKALWEISILERYLPKQLDEDKLVELIGQIIAELGEDKSAKMIGFIMSRLKAGHNGQYNPQKASEIARNLLLG